MFISRAEIKDLNVIFELQKLCYEENALRYSDPNIPPLTQTINDIYDEFTGSLFLKCVLEDKIVGSVRANERDGTCYIGKLIVHPEYQNRGIGKKLMKEIESVFEHIKRYELFTGYKDDKNLYLYKKLGYREFKSVQIKNNLFLIYLEKER